MKFIYLLILSFLCSCLLFGQSDSTRQTDLYLSTVEEILGFSIQDKKIEITSASGTSENLTDVPSSVIVFTRKQIQDMGIEDVYDLLNQVPGFQSIRSISTNDYQQLSVRGIKADNKVLFLINGQRLNESYAARANLFNRILSTANVKQIEVIRGPGSAIFGSNAFLGVVNIITDNENNELFIHLGSQQSFGSSVNFSQTVTNDFIVSASANFYEDAGANFDINGTTTQDPRSFQNVYTQLKFKDFTFNGAYSRIRNEDFIAFQNIGNGINRNTTTYWHGDISYDANLSSKVNLNISAAYNRFFWDLIGLNLRGGQTSTTPFDFIIGPYLLTSEFQLATDLQLNLNDQHKLVFGVNYRNSGVNNFEGYTNHVSPDRSFSAPIESFYIGEIKRFNDFPQLASIEQFLNILGGYFQYRATIGENLLAFAGTRFDSYFDISSTFNPRLGLVYKTSFGSTFKALYNTAFRAPTINELYIETPLDIGNPELQPERIQTLEFIWLQKFKKAEIALTLFNNQIRDFVVGAISQDNRATSANSSEKINTSGIEMMVNATILKNFFAQIAYTHYFSGNNTNYFNNFVSFIFNFQKKKWNINLNGIYRPELDENILAQNSYAILNGKIRYSLNKKFGLNISVLNLLDKSFNTFADELPAFNFQIPNRGRQWRIGMEFRFNR